MLLLDTNIWFKFYWRLSLPPALKSRIERDGAAVSPISALEIAIKIRRGKLPGVPPIDEWLERALEGYFIATITPEIAAAAGADNWEHQDPADRILVNTALATKFVLAHSDSLIQKRKDIQQLYVKIPLS